MGNIINEFGLTNNICGEISKEVDDDENEIIYPESTFREVYKRNEKNKIELNNPPNPDRKERWKKSLLNENNGKEDVDEKDLNIEQEGVSEELWLFCYDGDWEMAKKLMDKKRANPNYSADGWNLMSMIIERNHFKCAYYVMLNEKFLKSMVKNPETINETFVLFNLYESREQFFNEYGKYNNEGFDLKELLEICTKKKKELLQIETEKRKRDVYNLPEVVGDLKNSKDEISLESKD